MSWQLVYSRQAQKDAKKLAAAHLKKQTQVYEVFPDRKIVRILRMWAHYD